MLSSQALNVGRSLGQGQGLAIVDSAVREYHVYEDVWKPAIGEKLHAEQEPDNAVDKFAMKVAKKQWEIPCMLVFICSSKAKINCLKEPLESKIRR